MMYVIVHLNILFIFFNKITKKKRRNKIRAKLFFSFSSSLSLSSSFTFCHCFLIRPLLRCFATIHSLLSQNSMNTIWNWRRTRKKILVLSTHKRKLKMKIGEKVALSWLALRSRSYDPHKQQILHLLSLFLSLSLFLCVSNVHIYIQLENDSNVEKCCFVAKNRRGNKKKNWVSIVKNEPLLCVST